ncbi:trimethylamine methyltransferase family protein [Selenihalanaerobacter shriftii]|uniref:Trimethylamine---corrinoid protein Co-methyltransferase n=1 Tax=Selenihalanaerobacter shriftii TaxID=142842 RepID=A0A1T4JJR2_9FIRM|nr:trimethylamine methyltransferase family protein [Selenihalanaerobacter shriftii]SJZ30358.1 trimethylamine---corrinoid protein Co-methyltransferase [Selenihalanaerobacter shriftii]
MEKVTSSNFKANASTVLEVLSEDQCQEILSAAMEVLERTGVVYHYDEALETLDDAGCYVDGNRVRIPSRLVEKALRSVPSRVTLYNSRTKEPVLRLEGSNAYFGTGSDTPYFIDPYTQERIKASEETVKMATKVIDALPNLDFVMSLGIVQDVPQPIYDRYQFRAQILNTSKPIVTTATDVDGYADIIEMCEIVAGGEEELRQKPFMTLYAEPISPLQHDNDASNKLVLAGKKSLPVVYTPCIMAGGTVPATLAGAMANGLAESLSGLVLNQLTNEGNPFIMGGVFTIMDMDTTIFSYGAPEFDLMQAALADMAHYLGIPMFGTCGCTDSKVVDEQAAIEDAISILMTAQSGANLNHDVGYIEHGNAGCLENLAVADDLIGMARRVVDGIEVTEETLALDVIDEVGPGGHFLSHEHTMEHFKEETWYPDLFQRKRYGEWVNDGEKTLTDRANDKVIEILENYDPEPLPQDTVQKLDDIVKRAESNLDI